MPNLFGVIAQLGERLNGIQEVGGSIPLNSTIVNLSRKIFVFAEFSQRTTMNHPMREYR